jgi:branched-subunit amino acid ABC-type transport system permease component
MLVNGVLLGGLYCLLGIGMTLIFGVMRIINACHGDLLMVAMYLAFFLFTAIKLDPFVAIFVAMPVLFVLGCAIYSGLIRRLRGEFAENSLILTWGVALVLANLFTVAFSGDYRSIVTSYSTKNLTLAGISLSIPMLLSFGVAVLLSVALYLFLLRSNRRGGVPRRHPIGGRGVAGRDLCLDGTERCGRFSDLHARADLQARRAFRPQPGLGCLRRRSPWSSRASKPR